MWKSRSLEKNCPIPSLTKDDKPEIHEDKYINFLSKASNGLDSVEMFEFECETANFWGSGKNEG